jgi:hypothetical protein
MFNSILKWVAMCFALTGALLTSFQITPINVYLLNVGSLLYAIWAFRIKEVNIIVVNVGLLIIYVMGVIHHHGWFEQFDLIQQFLQKLFKV